MDKKDFQDLKAKIDTNVEIDVHKGSSDKRFHDEGRILFEGFLMQTEIATANMIFNIRGESNPIDETTKILNRPFFSEVTSKRVVMCECDELFEVDWAISGFDRKILEVQQHQFQFQQCLSPDSQQFHQNLGISFRDVAYKHFIFCKDL